MNNNEIDLSEIKDSLDIYSSDGTCLGISNREIVHDNGFLHYSIHCWVWTIIKNDLYVAFQKRKQTKRLFPSKFDVAAAGHYICGEYGRDGLRELVEELGLPLSDYEISYIATENCNYKDESINNNEKCNIYSCLLNSPYQNIAFDSSEIEDIVFGKADGFLSLFSNDINALNVYSLKEKQEIFVELNDFISQYITYYSKYLNILRNRFESLHQEMSITEKKYYTFIMLKPDAVDRNLVDSIIDFFVTKGFTIELFDIVLAQDDMVFAHYRDKIIEEGEIYKTKAIKYFHGKFVVPIIISNNNNNIIAQVRELIGFKDPQFADKNTVRGCWGIDSMKKSEEEIRCCENLIHASDSYASFKRESMIWFKRILAEKYLM